MATIIVVRSFFMPLLYSIFQLESTCKKKAPALLPLVKAAISWREKKYYHSSYAFIFILYIL